MRVLLVNDYGYEAGGAETYVFALRDLLAAQGHEVRLVADQPRLVHHVSRFFNPWYLLKFMGIIAAWKPDVVHIHKYNLVYSFAPSLAAKLMRRRVVVTVHDAGIFCPDGLNLRADGSECRKYFDRACFGSRCYQSTTPKLDLRRRLTFLRNALQVPMMGRTADAFLCPSRAVRDWTAHHYGARAHLLPYFTGVPAKIPPPPAPSPDGTLRAFFAGRLVREKGLHAVIEALPGLPVTLTVAGDGPCRAELEALAAARGVAGQVRWLGKIPNVQIPERVREAQVCLLPSIWLENNPLFGYETMRGARALAGSRIGGIPDMIEDGVNGFLFEKGNPAAVREVFAKLLSADLAALGLNGYAKARRDYDPDDHCRRLLGFYRGAPASTVAA